MSSLTYYVALQGTTKTGVTIAASSMADILVPYDPLPSGYEYLGTTRVWCSSSYALVFNSFVSGNNNFTVSIRNFSTGAIENITIWVQYMIRKIV